MGGWPGDIFVFKIEECIILRFIWSKMWCARVQMIQQDLIHLAVCQIAFNLWKSLKNMTSQDLNMGSPTLTGLKTWQFSNGFLAQYHNPHGYVMSFSRFVSTPVMSTVMFTSILRGLVWPSPQVRSHGPQEVQGDMRQSTSICWMGEGRFALFMDHLMHCTSFFCLQQSIWYVLDDYRGHLDVFFQFHYGWRNRSVRRTVCWKSKFWFGIMGGFFCATQLKYADHLSTSIS